MKNNPTNEKSIIKSGTLGIMVLKPRSLGRLNEIHNFSSAKISESRRYVEAVRESRSKNKIYWKTLRLELFRLFGYSIIISVVFWVTFGVSLLVNLHLLSQRIGSPVGLMLGLFCIAAFLWVNDKTEIRS